MHRRILIALLALLTLPPEARGQAPQELEKRLQQLEQRLASAEGTRRDQASRIERLEAELEQSKRRQGDAEERLSEVEEERGHEVANAKLVRLVDEAARSHGLSQPKKRPAFSMGSYFDLEFRVDQAGDKAVRFDQHRLVLRVASDVSDLVAFRTEIEVEGGGADVSFLSDNEVKIEYAGIHFRFDEAFNLKAGALLIPFNRYNGQHDSPLQELTDRPLVDRRIIPTTWAEPGVGVYGSLYPNDWAMVSYQLLVTNGFTDRLSAHGGTRSARPSYRADNNDDKTIIAHIELDLDFAFFDTLQLGGSFLHGKYDDDNQRGLTLWGVDGRLQVGDFEIVGEAAFLSIERGAEEIAAGIPEGMSGFYVEARYHFFPDSWEGSLEWLTNQSSFTAIVRYGEADTDTSGTAVDFASYGDRYRDDRRRLTFGFNFRPTQRSVFKMEYQWFIEPSGVPSVDNNRFVISFATYF